MNLKSIIRLGTGKLFGAYLFLGSSISLLFVTRFWNLENLNSNEIFYLIISLGGVIGTILYLSQFHNLSNFLYGNLRKMLENDYQSFDEQRDDYYYRFVLVFGGFGLLFALNDASKLFFRENIDHSFLFLCLIVLSVILCAFWVKSFYSNRNPLLLFRYILNASEEMKGLGNLDEKIRQINKELRGGNWDEAKFQFSYILDVCNKILTDLPLRRRGEVDLRKYGFIFIDFKNQKKNRKIQGIVRIIRGLEKTKNISIMRSNNEDGELLSGVLEREKELKKEIQDWKIKDWDSYFRTNLLWWLKLDCYVLDALRKMTKE